MDKKILDVFENPPVITTDEYTHVLSIALCNPNAYAWLIENYIQILTYYQNGFKEVSPMFYNFINYSDISNTEYCLVGSNRSCPFLDLYRHTYDEYKHYNMTILEYIKNKIRENFYVFINLDVSKIKAYKFSENFSRHCPLIIGFDEELQVFYIRDYCNRKYDTFTATFLEIKNAFSSFVNRCSMDSDLKPFYDYGINFIRLNDGGSYSFSIHKMIELLNDYLSGNEIKETYNKFFTNEDFFYGIETYDIIINALRNCTEQGGDDIGEIFKFSLLQDHKHVMILRLNFLKENKYISFKEYNDLYPSFKQAEDISLICKRLYLKYTYKKDKILIDRIISNLQLLKTIDKHGLTNLLKKLH